jgi:hypothetical protein
MARLRAVIVLVTMALLLVPDVIAQDRPRTPARETLMAMAWPKNLDRRATLVGPAQIVGNNIVYTFREPTGTIKVLIVEIQGTELGTYSLFALQP